jgi:hypothetical protein
VISEQELSGSDPQHVPDNHAFDRKDNLRRGNFWVTADSQQCV